MSNRALILNNLLDIGGVATMNNFYSESAKSITGNLLQTRKLFKFYLQQGLIFKIPTIGKTRNPSQETFYCLTKKGAQYIGRPEEYKYKRYGRSPNNIMHESMKFDIAMSFLRLYPDKSFKFAYDKSLYHVKPDIIVKVEDGKRLKYLLIEIERKKTVERVLKEKIEPYEKMFNMMIEKKSHNPFDYLILFIYTDIWFDIFARPQSYANPVLANQIVKANMLVKNLVNKYCKHLPTNRYLFTGFHNFYRIHDSVWLTTTGNRVALPL